ncbi:MAG TPA: glycoside hydrolase family 27 protein, partial [Acidobacteriaceae bacterium]|nr:glycoside hydrolase family 27 protein [Acidobacteriaceae bacterium]
SWSFMRGRPTEEKMKAQAEALIANHLDQLGYRYINVDSGWTRSFDDHGIPAPDLTAFPDGMNGMAKWMHEHGLLFGIYLNPGISPELLKQNPQIEGTSAHIADITDTSQPGSTHRGSYRIDFSKPAAAAYIHSQAAKFDRWNIDFIKMDFVGPGGGNLPADNREEMRQWHAALAKASHPIWLELSNYMSIDQAPLWRATSNGWRIDNDIECYSACDKSTDPNIKGNLTIWSKVVTRFADVVEWLPFDGAGTTANPAAGWQRAPGGGWNDLDSLELGNGDKDGITPDERQSMFLLWSISCAPLFLGTDLTHMDPDDLKLLSNPEIVAIDQAGIPAHPLDIQHLRKKPQQAWMTKYPDGTVVLTLFNLDRAQADVKLDWREIDALRDTNLAARVASGRAPVLHDLISGADTSATADGLNLTLAPHASRIFRIAAK